MRSVFYHVNAAKDLVSILTVDIPITNFVIFILGVDMFELCACASLLV